MDLSNLRPDQLRELLPGFLSGFLEDPALAARNRKGVAALVDRWSDAEAEAVLRALAAAGAEPRMYAAEPITRALSRRWAEDVVDTPVQVGVEHLADAVDRGPTVVVGNHLSYFDSNAIDAILAWSGHAALADRLVSAAGPKVYADLFRRVASCCLNTLPVPQSTRFSHTEAMAPRELARRALASVQAAREAAAEGKVLLIYPEGSRSRTGRLQPFLPAVRRYLDIAGRLSVVPAAITGTQRIMPVGGTQLRSARVSLTWGTPLTVSPDHPPRAVLQQAHDTIASMLPPDYRPDEGAESTG